MVAVIDIGATSVRMQVAQINVDGTVERLESLSQAMSIGKDSFIQGWINRRTTEDCTVVLKSFRKKLEEYGVDDPRAIRVVATSGVREASIGWRFRIESMSRPDSKSNRWTQRSFTASPI